jgi:hypothetical protein
MDEILTLSLTGPGSHRLRREAGVGSLVVGPADGQQRPDLAVAPDAAIDWRVLDGMRTGAGNNWPRWITYEGRDTAIFDWMRVRETERLSLVARGALTLDASEAWLYSLTIQPGAHDVVLTLPRRLRGLEIIGDPAKVQFRVPEGGAHPGLILAAPEGGRLTAIGDLPHLARTLSLGIRNAVLGDGFDCRSLLPIAGLRHLSLHGAMAHLDALAGLPLERLDLRFVADLEGLPDLAAWPGLRHLIAWNVEEGGGKALRKALKARPLAEPSYVTHLRSRQWFVEEHGLPFGAWTSRNERAASKAFKVARKALLAAADKPAAEVAIRDFVGAINRLADIETGEREDAGQAVVLLAGVRPGLISREEALAWFDDARDF